MTTAEAKKVVAQYNGKPGRRPASFYEAERLLNGGSDELEAKAGAILDAAFKNAKATPPTKRGREQLVEAGTKIPPLSIKTVRLSILGTSPYLSNQSDFARKEDEKIVALLGGGKKPEKEVRDPVKEFLSSLRPFPGGTPKVRETKEGRIAEGRFGIPCQAFLKAMVRAGARGGKALPMNLLRTVLKVHGTDHSPLVLITDASTGKPAPAWFDKHAIMKKGGGGATLVYRGAFHNWACTLDIQYDSTVLTVQEVVALLQWAGVGVGVGAYRPEGPNGGGGPMGCWDVKIS